MKRTILNTALFLALAAALFAFRPAGAQTPLPTGSSDDAVNSVAHELYCPVCENIPLDVCPTTACARWRELIRQKLDAGWNKQQIVDYFAAQYGDRVLAVPPLQRSFNQLLPVLIGLGILIALALVVWALRGAMRARPRQAEEPTNQIPGVDEEYLKRIEEDLRRRG
jgi:cytochrome c-type biogenesis protein CcmH